MAHLRWRGWAIVFFQGPIAMASAFSREEMRSYLGKPVWPLSRLLLASVIRRRGAPANVLEALQHLPDRPYRSESDLWREFQACFDPEPHR